MESDKLLELSTLSYSKDKCPYVKNCGDEEIRACYGNYKTCTIYQRKEIVSPRMSAINTELILRINKIVE